MLLKNQYVLALFCSRHIFSLDIFRVMFWAMVYSPWFFLSLIIINVWHWESEDTRWKPKEFVGSTALAAQKTHTSWHIRIPSCTCTIRTAVSVQSSWSFIFYLFKQVWCLQMYHFKSYFHSNSQMLWFSVISVSRGGIGKQLFRFCWES